MLKDLGLLGVAYCLVAIVAVPVGVAAAVWSVRSGQALIPSWKRPGRLPRFGLTAEAFDFLYIVCFFAIYAGLLPALVLIGQKALEMAGFFELLYGLAAALPDGRPDPLVRRMWGMAVAAPAVLALWLVYRRSIGSGPLAVGRVVRDVAVGVAVWVVTTPVVFAVHLVANVVAVNLGIPPDQHELSRLGTGESPTDQVFFALAVCLITPLVEEVMFRGLLVGWAQGRRYRPWILLILAGCLPLLATSRSAAPIGFIAILAAGLFALRFVRRLPLRFPVRTVASIYATAALFAAAHSAVWPTPVPLFVLGLALGCLAARTNGVTACIVLHGLFNAVSFVYLLRGGSG